MNLHLLVDHGLSLIVILQFLNGSLTSNPSMPPINHIVASVQLPKLAIGYYDRLFLSKVGNTIGEMLKVDLHTATQSRGKFAMVYVELDLNKPLSSHFLIDGRIHYVEYEGLHLICYNCRKVNAMEYCPEGSKSMTFVEPRIRQ